MLDVAVMWCMAYPKNAITSELFSFGHQYVEACISWCQQQAIQYTEGNMIFAEAIAKLAPDSAQSNPAKPRGIYIRVLQRPAGARTVGVAKRPAARARTIPPKKAMLKKPAATRRAMPKTARAILRPKAYRRRVVIQVDETLANGSRKKSRLAKMARPKRDQIRVHGLVVEDQPSLFYFRVLEHPADAYEGKPCGNEELKRCLESIGLKKECVLVPDSWRGTVAAVKNLKAEKGWSETDLPHELVNHSAGEIVNAHGYSTNQIEATWSVLKRWLRKRFGGRLPSKTDRAAWSTYLGEFTWRKLMQSEKGSDTLLGPEVAPMFFRAVAELRRTNRA